jgi:hypothetical protein
VETERPWTLSERFDEAERMARAGHSIDEIAERCRLVRISAACIVGRVRGDNDFSALRKGSKDDAQ